MKKSYKKIFLLVFLFFSFFLVMPVSAIWSIKSQESQNLIGTNTGTVNVYIRYIKKTQKTIRNETKTTLVDDSGSLLNQSVYNEWLPNYETHQKNPYLVGTTTPVDDGNGNITWTETYHQIETCEKTWYNWTVLVYQIVYTYIQNLSIEVSNSSEYTYVVPKGSTIEKPSLSLEGYTFVNYFSANDTNTDSSGELFDFSQPINQNTVIYAEWTHMLGDNEQFEENQLTSHINNLTSGNTSNIYAGGAATFNLNDDSSYSSQSSTVNLGSSSLQTTISSGTTVNFSMNDGRVDVEGRADNSITDPSKHTVGTGENITNDTYISLDYFKEKTETVQDLSKKNPRDYTIILQNDLIVNGNLYLGGYTGSSSSIQGYIVNNYVSLDLNGHQLIINNGGMVHSFGYIYDSMGTGSVEVMPGGNLKTQVVLYDVKGGNTTLWGFSKGISPFENYGFPYLNCEVHFYSNGSQVGTLDVFTKLNLGSLGVTNIYIPFFGKDVSTYLMTYSKEATASEVLIGTYDVYTGIFETTNQEQYIFYTDTNLLVDSSNTESAFNEITDLVKITNIDDRQIVNYNNSSYIYYSGIWCPVVESIMDESGNETGLVINTQKLSTEGSYTYTRYSGSSSEKFTYSFSRTPMKYVSTTTYQVWQVIMKNFGDNGDNYTTKS